MARLPRFVIPDQPQHNNWNNWNNWGQSKLKLVKRNAQGATQKSAQSPLSFMFVKYSK